MADIGITDATRYTDFARFLFRLKEVMKTRKLYIITSSMQTAELIAQIHFNAAVPYKMVTKRSKEFAEGEKVAAAERKEKELKDAQQSKKAEGCKAQEKKGVPEGLQETSGVSLSDGEDTGRDKEKSKRCDGCALPLCEKCEKKKEESSKLRKANTTYIVNYHMHPVPEERLQFDEVFVTVDPKFCTADEIWYSMKDVAKVTRGGLHYHVVDRRPAFSDDVDDIALELQERFELELLLFQKWRTELINRARLEDRGAAEERKKLGVGEGKSTEVNQRALEVLARLQKDNVKYGDLPSILSIPADMEADMLLEIERKKNESRNSFVKIFEEMLEDEDIPFADECSKPKALDKEKKERKVLIRQLNRRRAELYDSVLEDDGTSLAKEKFGFLKMFNLPSWSPSCPSGLTSAHVVKYLRHKRKIRNAGCLPLDRVIEEDRKRLVEVPFTHAKPEFARKMVIDELIRELGFTNLLDRSTVDFKTSAEKLTEAFSKLKLLFGVNWERDKRGPLLAAISKLIDQWCGIRIVREVSAGSDKIRLEPSHRNKQEYDLLCNHVQ